MREQSLMSKEWLEYIVKETKKDHAGYELVLVLLSLFERVASTYYWIKQETTFQDLENSLPKELKEHFTSLKLSEQQKEGLLQTLFSLTALAFIGDNSKTIYTDDVGNFAVIGVANKVETDLGGKLKDLIKIQ